MSIPQDPFILFSVINTKLRDTGNTLDEICSELDCNKDEVISRIESIGYKYNLETNSFE